MSTFPLFNSFPPEIQSLILDSCPDNDRICLSLTCKYLYNFSSSSKKPIPLQSTDTGPLCHEHGLTGEPGSLSWGIHYLRYQHRQICHQQSYEVIKTENDAKGRTTPEMKKCRTGGWKEHCECSTIRRRLHLRLNSWMPKGFSYCGKCDRFTRRKRGHNGRCYHGNPKPRKPRELFWTHRARKGAFGRKLWKKWFNNEAMNSLESRLRHEVERKGTGRYGMRKLKPQEVDTTRDRDN